MKILVTGADGLVGNAFRRIQQSYADHEWVFVTRRMCNLENKIDVNNLFDIEEPDVVIHLAAKVGGLYMNIRNNLTMYKENVAINTNIIDACVDYNVSKCIICLSTCVFPDRVCESFTEEDLHMGEPHDSNNGYAYAKRQAEIYSRLQMKRGCHTKFYCVSPTNMYGPNDNFELNNSHVVPALIMKAFLIYASESESSLVVKGSGLAKRQFMYVDDFANIIMRLILGYDGPESHFIVAPDWEHTINDLAIIICRSMKIHDTIVHTPVENEGQMRKFANANKLLSLPCMDDFQFTPLDEGIQTTVDWVKNNGSTMRR